MCPRDTAPSQFETFHPVCPDLQSDDDRMGVIRLGSRLAELRKLALQGDGDHRDAALETLQHDVPLANRLRMRRLCTRLEDACFRLMDPAAYRALASAVQLIQEEDAACLELLKKCVNRLLEKNHLNAAIEERIKGLYSLHQKILSRNCSLQEIMDKIGLRVLVPSVRECYLVLGLLHTHFRHIPGSFDDYIGRPEQNGDQSLHTCIYPVSAVCDKPVEIQIRTYMMHQESEYGLAAHRLYKCRQRSAPKNRRQTSRVQTPLRHPNQRMERSL